MPDDTSALRKAETTKNHDATQLNELQKLLSFIPLRVES